METLKFVSTLGEKGEASDVGGKGLRGKKEYNL